MTGTQIITLVDMKEPNSYSAEEKISWLSTLDGTIFNEVILTHEHGEVEFTPYSDGTETLLIGSPYGEDLYTHYLMARIAEGNAETARYNQQIALYNAAYSRWWNKYNATHMPLHGGGRFLF